MKYSTYIILLLLLASCNSFYLNSMKRIGLFDNQAYLEEIKVPEKKVIFVPMQHVGTKDYYKDVKYKMDSLQNLGFKPFIESIIIPDYLDINQKEYFYKKFRKITGNVGNLYLDTINNTFVGKVKLPNNHNLINQPPNDELFDMSEAVNIDAHLDSIILKFEKMHGTIALTKCDLETDIYDLSYNCKTLDKKTQLLFKELFTLRYRDSIIADATLKSNNRKIVLVYGKNHFEGLKKFLEINKSQ